jgi:hypothetical protein
MESLLRKSLNRREKCFEKNVCPTWLLSILPTRIKSVESIVDNDNEQQIKIDIDLSPYQLISSIPQLNQQISKETNSYFEYPNQISFQSEQLNNYSQFICSPSNQQLIYLFKQLKQFQEKKTKNSLKKNENKCEEENCFNRSIPLTSFCKIHLLEKNFKQILFVKCHHCQQISIKEDNKNLIHFCPYFN